MNLKRWFCPFSWMLCCAMVAAAEPVPQTQPAPADSRAAARTPPPAVAPAPASASSAATTQPLRDPTQIDAALAQALAGQAGAAQPQNLVVQVTRRGMIAIAGRPTVALIELQGGGSFFVQKGSVLTASVGGVKATITVETLSPDQMTFSADSKNVTVVVR
jgi:hypothetical protein